MKKLNGCTGRIVMLLLILGIVLFAQEKKKEIAVVGGVSLKFKVDSTGQLVIVTDSIKQIKEK